MRPPVGTAVVVTAQPDPAAHRFGEGGAATRVEDDLDGAVAIAEPPGPGDVDPPGPGDRFLLRWTDVRGVHEMPARLRRRAPGSSAPGASRVTLWWLEPAGAVRVDQRREFVRTQTDGWPAHVQLTWFLPTEASAEGFLCDLSEGGLRAALRDWPGGDGVPVLVRLTMAESAGDGVAVQEHELLATALRSAPSPGGDGTTEVSVRFHEPVPRADELRSLVFAWQRALRRQGHSSSR